MKEKAEKAVTEKERTEQEKIEKERTEYTERITGRAETSNGFI